MTGVGLVSPLGIGTQANWEALCAGRSGIGPITRFDASQFSARIAGEVKDFDPLQFVEKKDVKKMDEGRTQNRVPFLLHPSSFFLHP